MRVTCSDIYECGTELGVEGALVSETDPALFSRYHPTVIQTNIKSQQTATKERVKVLPEPIEGNLP